MTNDKGTLKDEGKSHITSEQSNNPIKKPEQVPSSNDEKIDRDFPGYPHYPANEDILNSENASGRVEADVEKLSRANNINASDLAQGRQKSTSKNAFPEPQANQDSDLGRKPDSDSDVTKEDLMILGRKDRDMDGGDDEKISDKLEVTGDDLDVPGAELDDDNEAIGEEDEENNYYSLGGDNHENLEEDTTNG